MVVKSSKFRLPHQQVFLFSVLLSVTFFLLSIHTVPLEDRQTQLRKEFTSFRGGRKPQRRQQQQQQQQNKKLGKHQDQGGYHQTTILSPLGNTTTMTMKNQTLIIATRIHLGNASAPPSESKLQTTLERFASFAKGAVGVLGKDSQQKPSRVKAYIAVDATPRFSGYSLVDTIQNLVVAKSQQQQQQDDIDLFWTMEVLPIMPWGNFVPALNAIVSRAARLDRKTASLVLFCSAETNASSTAIQTLVSHLQPDTLVAGAVLAGHHYQAPSLQETTFRSVILDGRTTPWNTLAVWNIAKLALTGFPLVGEGVHTQRHLLQGKEHEKGDDDDDDELLAGGVEEVSAISLLQHILGRDQAKAKLVPLPDLEWSVDFDHDDERRAWHERKMKSKIERPAKHLQLLHLPEATVQHYG